MLKIKRLETQNIFGAIKPNCLNRIAFSIWDFRQRYEITMDQCHVRILHRSLHRSLHVKHHFCTLRHRVGAFQSLIISYVLNSLSYFSSSNQRSLLLPYLCAFVLYIVALFVLLDMHEIFVVCSRSVSYSSSFSCTCRVTHVQ